MAPLEQPNQLPATIWDAPAGAEVNVGWRHLGGFVATVAIGTLVGALGTLSFPSGDTPSGFAPAIEAALGFGAELRGYALGIQTGFVLGVGGAGEREQLPLA